MEVSNRNEHPALAYWASAKAPYWGFFGPGGSFYRRQKWFSPQFVYVVASGRDERPVKIGISVDVTARLRQFEAGNPYGLRSLHTVELCLGTAPQVEAWMHARFHERALGREWFDVSLAEVLEALTYAASRATVAARRYKRELLVNDHVAAKATARAQRQRDQERQALYQRNREIAAEKRRATLASNREIAAMTARERGPRRGPRPPLNFVSVGGGPAGRLARYKAARGIA